MASRRATVAREVDYAFLKRQAAARLRGSGVDLNRKHWMKYGADVDMLTVRFKEKPYPTNSTSNDVKGIIYNYEGKELVSIEILDISAG